MFRSLKTKLLAGMFILLIVAFGVSAVLLIKQKTVELSQDLYVSVKSFSDLTSTRVVTLYDRYLAEESFIYFNREVQGLFDKSEDVVGLALADYGGTILYDSSEETARQYTGEARLIDDNTTLQRIQATYPSYLLETDRVVYLRTDEDGKVDFLNASEETVTAIDPLERVVNVIYPVGSRYAVLYAPSYAVVDARIQAMWVRIILLAAFAVFLGLTYAYFFSTGITRPIQVLRKGAEQLGTGDFSTRVEVKTHDEVGVLAGTFNQMAEDLEKSVEAKLYQERVTKELELAGNIQKQLIPEVLPHVPGLDLAAGIIPAEQVGGDVYDVFTPDNENFFGYVGDVTGHGVPASLVVSIANALFHSYAPLKDPSKILIEVNKIIKAKTTTNMFITLALWHWNVTTQKLSLVSAGHEIGLHYRAAAVKTDELKKGGIALGMLPDITDNLQPQVIDLANNDCVILYTDGVPESWRNEKEQYGMPNFKRVVTQSCDLPTAEAIKVALLADVKQWSGKYEQKDDITVMVLRRGAAPAKSASKRPAQAAATTPTQPVPAAAPPKSAPAVATNPSPTPSPQPGAAKPSPKEGSKTEPPQPAS